MPAADARQGTCHWSRPGALRTLRALVRLGFSATTWQIAEQTGSLAVHSDVTSLRCFCHDEGICIAEKAVRCTYEGTTDARHRVYRYSLHKLVVAAIRDGRIQLHPEEAQEHRDATPVPDAPRRGKQGRLFEVAAPGLLRRRDT